MCWPIHQIDKGQRMRRERERAVAFVILAAVPAQASDSARVSQYSHSL